MDLVSQSDFTQALLNPGLPHPTGLVDSQGEKAGRRFDVYRNNVAVSLTEALEQAFPVVAKLVGEQNFKVLAGAFLRKHQPATPLMMYYGAEFPAFLTTFPPTQSIGYLPDVARLELALRESYHSADSVSIAPERLQNIAPEKLMLARLILAPSVRVLVSDWPVFSIWRYNTETNAPKPEMAAEAVLIARPEFDAMPFLLPVGGGGFLDALQENAPLGEAVEAAGIDFDLTQTLALLMSTGAIVDVGG